MNQRRGKSKFKILSFMEQEGIFIITKVQANDLSSAPVWSNLHHNILLPYEFILICFYRKRRLPGYNSSRNVTTRQKQVCALCHFYRTRKRTGRSLINATAIARHCQLLTDCEVYMCSGRGKSSPC